MGKELIARLARLSGFFSDGDRIGADDEFDVSRELARFAALIAEECAKIAENVHIPFARDDGETLAAAAIRDAFRPK